MELSNVLRQLRESRGIGQKELADALNYSTSTVSNYENGVHFPNPDTLCALADYYGVTTDYLLGRKNHPYSEKILEQHISEIYTVDDLLRLLYRLPDLNRQTLVDFIMSIENLLSVPLQAKKSKLGHLKALKIEN